MLRKRNTILLISLVILLSANAFVYWLHRSDSSLRMNKDIFRVEDFNVIDRIRISNADRAVELSFDGISWKVNGKSDADKGLIDLLFATLQQAEPKRPVASRIQDSARHQLEVTGSTIELFVGSQRVRSFLAGGNEHKTQTYFKKLDDPTPYIMTIPGYRVYVAGIFELHEFEWWDKYIFGFNWQNFKRLEATFPNNPQNNFEVIMRNRMPAIEGIAEPDTTKLNDFMDAVSLLRADYFVGLNPDSLRQKELLMSIKIQDIANRQYSLDIFYDPDSDLYQGIAGDSRIGQFEHRKLESILKNRNHFK